jgi:hypothetical protein
MTLPELLERVGADNINFQMLNAAMTNITATKRDSKITFLTDALTPTHIATDTGPIGLIVWCDRAAWDAALPKGSKS